MQHIGSSIQEIKYQVKTPSLTPTPESSNEKTQPPASTFPCSDCGGKGFLRVDVPPQHSDFGKPVRCPNPVHQPAYVERLARLSGLTQLDLEIRLDQFRENHYVEDDVLVSNRAMLDEARRFVKDPYGFFYIHGSHGNAKTDTLIAIVNQVNKAAGSVVAVYIKFSKLVEYMRESYVEAQRRRADPDALLTYTERFNQVKTVKVLAIDEFDFDGDKVRETNFVKEFRFDFLDDRYHLAVQGKTATIFASNSPPEALPPAIYDRVRDGRFKIVHNTAPSSRPVMRRAA